MGPAVDVELNVSELDEGLLGACHEEPLSPEEIERFRGQLLQLRQWLLQSIAQLEAQGSPASSGRMVSLEGDDLAWQNAIRQRAMADKRLMLNEIMRAFERIGDNTFGTCVNDGCTISRSLLEEVPWARFCASCATRHS